jgi:uncharacterized protein
LFEVFPKSVRFDDTALITGFHGIGYAGYWTIKYLIQKLNAERVAFVDSETVSPVTTTNQGRLVTPYQFFRKENMVMFKVEVPPYRGTETDFFRSLCEWIMKSRIREVALIGGLDSSLRTDSSAYRLVTTSTFEPKGELAKAPRLEDEHIIVGPVAIMLNYFESRDFPAFAVLAYASTDRVDPRAAVSSIEVLSKYYAFKVDVSPLVKGAEVLESEIAKQETKVKKTGESIYT